MSETVTIARRYNGPPGSGNGGYSCGVVATMIGGPAEVTLRLPPPLDTPMEVQRDSDGTVALMLAGAPVAQGRPHETDVEVPSPVDLERAERASLDYYGFSGHPFPTCFTCGPERAAGDGLRIFPGPVNGRILAAPWVPDPSMLDAQGTVRREVVWAALDCAGGWSALLSEEPGQSPGVLGRMTARLLRPPGKGERIVVTGWPIGREGRKRFAGTALHDESGELIAASRQVWIQLG